MKHDQHSRSCANLVPQIPFLLLFFSKANTKHDGQVQNPCPLLLTLIHLIPVYMEEADALTSKENVMNEAINC